jgi:hypothetical protein
MGSAAVRGGGSPPHATPPLANALRRPTWKRGRCSSPTSATDARHAHLTDHSTPEVAASLARSSPRPMEPKPQRTTRVTTRLTTRLELQPSPSRSRRSGGCGCHPILLGSRSSRAHRWHPLSAALSSADGPNVTTFDTRVATRVRRSAARAARTAFTAASSKATAPTTQGIFHRRVPARPTPLTRNRPRTRTRHRSRDFAAPTRLPTLFRPALPKEEELDPVASVRSSRPGAHGHAPLVDFCNRKDPQARPTDHRNPALESGRSTFVELPIS